MFLLLGILAKTISIINQRYFAHNAKILFFDPCTFTAKRQSLPDKLKVEDRFKKNVDDATVQLIIQ